MTYRSMAALLAGSTLLLLAAVTYSEAQAQKQPTSQLPPMPKGFDTKRNNIERGKSETVEYDSKSLSTKRKMVVYTPPGYSKDRKYPVFYLLHAANGNETSWSKAGSAITILDNLYADKKLEPMIVVMPNGTIGGGKGAGKGGDFAKGFEPELLNDVMPLAESRFPIIRDADHRAIAGISMGGGQTLNISLKHLDKFAWIGGFMAAGLQGKANLVSNPEDARKKLKLLYVGCGDADTLYQSNLAFHTSLEKAKVPHVWNVHPNGVHDYQTGKNDLYAYSQLLFKEKK